MNCNWSYYFLKLQICILLISLLLLNHWELQYLINVLKELFNGNTLYNAWLLNCKGRSLTNSILNDLFSTWQMDSIMHHIYYVFYVLHFISFIVNSVTVKAHLLSTFISLHWSLVYNEYSVIINAFLFTITRMNCTIILNTQL
jgi:hypothetical protein